MSSRSRPWLAIACVVLAASACAAGDSSDEAGSSAGDDAASTSSAIASTAAASESAVAESTTSTEVTTTTTTTATTEETAEMDPEDDRSACVSLTDFESEEANGRWLVVNDDVMGGRSDGGLSFVDGTLVFEGDINTNGGGFSSLRLPLEPEALVGVDRIEFRARPDDRTYMVTFDDDLPSRDRRVSHRAPIGFAKAGEWQTVSVEFGDLFPAIFGQPIDDLPFRQDLASRLGLMISDGLDGPFRLEVDRIDLCSDRPG